MEIKKNLLPESKYSLKSPYQMTPECIVVHNTANDASAENEIAYMIRNDLETSYHFAIDDKGVVQGLPLDRNGWHAGDGAGGKGNRKGIAIEICYSKSGGDRFTKAEANAAKFIAELLRERGWGIDRVTNHQECSGKYCPHRTLDLGWQRFLNMIQAELTAQQTPTAGVIYRVQVGAYENKTNAEDMLAKLKAAGFEGFIVTDGKEAVAEEPKAEKPVEVAPKAGDAVQLTNCPLYATATTTNVANKLTGTYYLWSTEKVSGRIRITNNKANVGKPGQVTGWIDAAKI